MKDVETIINNLAGIAGTLMGIERNHSELSEIIDKKIEHLSEVIKFMKEQQAEIEQLKDEKTKAFDYLFSKFAGHSNYHGDSILCAIEAVKEGKEIKTVKTMDKDGEQDAVN